MPKGATGRGGVRLRAMDRNVRCECGCRATRQVWFRQQGADGRWMVNWLPLCEECYEMMVREDRTVSLVPLPA